MILLKMNWFTRSLVNSKIINPCRPGVDWNPTGISVVRGPMTGSHPLIILQCCMLVFPKVLLLNSWFLTFRLEIFWKINLDQTAGIHKNNLDCKISKFCYEMLLILTSQRHFLSLGMNITISSSFFILSHQVSYCYRVR